MFRLSTKQYTGNRADETLLEPEEPEFNLPEASSTALSDEPEGVPSRFFDQLIICIICLIMLLAGLKSGHPGFRWVRERLHSAVEASTEATFGFFSRSPFLQGLICTGRSLVKLEEITPPLWQAKGTGPEETTATSRNVTLPGAVWPASGNVTRSFGWQYNPLTHAREFNSGIEITALTNAPVHALSSGEVVALAREPGKGWQVTVNHGAGWLSIYRNLGEVKVQIGQKVSTGSLVGNLNPSPTGNAQLWLEVRYQDQPVDPLTLFTA